MIGDNHKVANLKIRIHTAGSIRYEQGLNAQLVHHTYGEGDILHRVSLVEVETALHGHDVHTAQLAKDEFTAVAFHRRDGEVRDV